jgi:hypothetical protein
MASDVRAAEGGAIVGALTRVAMGGVAGLATGSLVGGVGGRIAMLILRVTSDPSLHGLESDDGFTIGVVSSQTTFLLVFTAVLGAIGGLVYVIVRAWLPDRSRPWLFGALTGLVGGSLVIHPDGVDFTLLEPLWLAIVLFVLLPAAYGVAVASLAEGWLRAAEPASRLWLVASVPALLPLVLLGPRALPFLVLALIVGVVADPRSAAGGGAVVAARRLARQGGPRRRRHRRDGLARRRRRADPLTPRGTRRSTSSRSRACGSPSASTPTIDR